MKKKLKQRIATIPVYSKVKQARAKRKHKEGSRTAYPPVYLNEHERNKLKSNHFPENRFTTSKYTLLSFVPLVLWEQFSKATTIYFTLIFIISIIPQISPITPWTSLMGLLFILVVAAVREGYEDVLRHKADSRVNRRRYLLVDFEGERVVTRSRWLHVGNLVYVRCDEQIPADLVLLATSNEDGICYIETSQLDGETNLKPRKAPVQTGHLTLKSLSELKGTLQCEVPHHVMYSFKGTLHLDSESQAIPLDNQQLLLQSSFLRNTDWAVGIIAYAGPETKLSLNQKKPPFKTSRLDKRLNKYVLILFVINMLINLGMGIGGGLFDYYYAEDSPYLTADPDGPWVAGVKLFFAYFALLSYLIPLSLVVSLELVKVIQARFMEWDYEMSTERGHMTVKTSNLNDELALVQYVFSDKTGTLTENQMDFRKCSVNGRAYENAGEGALRGVMDVAGRQEAKEIYDFLIAVAVCHSAVTDIHRKTKELIYKASSPDEEALCRAAKDNGIVFISRSTQSITVQVNGDKLVYEVLCSMEFTSDRRRMSVVVRTPEGELKLLTKGADTMMYSRLGDGDDELKEKTLQDLDVFSKEGLRTLVYAEKRLTEQECGAFLEQYNEAATLMDGREEAIDRVCDEFERNLNIIGATAIEDKLQDGVPETIAYLLEAGMRVWVITGDKQATAINIGYSSRLLNGDMELIIINAESTEECLELLTQHQPQDSADYDESRTASQTQLKRKRALVIDGGSIKFALKDHRTLFYNLARSCHSVICNRVTPLQKAKVVRLIKETSKEVCLSIGDGANDVGMIQEANVGVGIYGKEGNQAARASDFALHQFRHLKRLLCVHGRYSMIRNALIIHYSFYKNAAVFLAQVWFGIFSGFSSQTLYDDWVMTFFNILFTAWPPIAVAVFETDISHRVIEANPHVYKRVQSNGVFTMWSLCGWFAASIYHSLVIFFGAYFLWADGLQDTSGLDTGFYSMGHAILFVGIIVIFLKLFLHVNNWNWLVHFTVWGSLLLYIILVLGEGSVIYFFPNQFFVFFHICTMPIIYLWVLLGTVACLLPDFLFAYVQRNFFPEPWQILQEEDRLLKKRHIKSSSKNYGSLSDNPEASPVPIQAEWAATGSVKAAGTKSGGYSRLGEPLLASSSSAFNDSDSDN